MTIGVVSMNYPMPVFLDTNIFISCKYNMSTESNLGLLLRYINADKIKLFLSNIAKREIESHIDEDSALAVSQFKKALKEAKKCIAESSLRNTSLLPFMALPTEKNVQDEVKRQFIQFLEACKTVELDNKGVSIDSILDDYFLSKPPFEERNKKKHEFTDAIMIAKLKAQFAETECVWVVSSDKGFRDALNDNPKFKCLSRLQELFDLITRNDTAYQKIVEYITNKENEISTLILEKLNSSDIEIDSAEYDRKGMSQGYEYDETEVFDISNLKIYFDSVDEISDDKAFVILRCSAEFSAICSYNDYDEGVWDSEDKAYVFVPHYEVYEDHKADFYCELGLKFIEKDSDYEFNVESVNCDIKLDADSRISQVFHSSEEDGRAEQMEALEEYYRH